MCKSKKRALPHETKVQFRPLAVYHIFITQIHTVCLVSMNGEGSRVRPSKKKNFEKSWKREKKILGKNFGKKILKQKC